MRRISTLTLALISSLAMGAAEVDPLANPPTAAFAGDGVLLSVIVTPAEDPPSTGITVEADRLSKWVLGL